MPTGYPDKVGKDQVNIWRALKKLTGGEAKKIVMSVRNENGWEAWLRLRQRFAPFLAAKQGAVLADFSGMVAKPAKTPHELMVMISDMDRKIKYIEDVNQEEVPSIMAKGVLIGIMDPLTRQHTAAFHTLKYDELKPKVLTFASNAVNTGGLKDAMQMDRVEEGSATKGADGYEEYSGTEYFNALGGKGGGQRQCYNCLEWGHFARECPTKGKGGGWKGDHKGAPKGGDKGGFSGGFKGGAKGYPKGGKGDWAPQHKGKGKGKPMNVGCFICGGPHFQRECPQGGGKGGFRSLEESQWENHKL